MHDHSGDQSASGDADQDLLHNIDLSTLQGFGLDRFLPTRNEDEASGSGERQKDEDARVGEVRRREEDEGQETVGAGKRRRVDTSGSGVEGVDEDELNDRQEDQPEGQGSGRNALDNNEQEEGSTFDAHNRQEDGLATSDANNASPTPSPITNHTPMNDNDDQNDTVDDKEEDDEMTPERRKLRQKELNRLAALKSRGKKRGELAVLEQTITTIQDENARLRTRLEGLLQLASKHNNHNSNLMQPVASGSGTHAAPEEEQDTLADTGSGSGSGSGMVHVDMGPGMEVDLGGDGRQVGADGDGEEGTGDGEDMVVNGNTGTDSNLESGIDGSIGMLDSSGMQLPATSSVIPDQQERRTSVETELGLDMSRIGVLQRELDGLRRRLEARSELQAASLEGEADHVNGVGDGLKDEDDEERTALLAHVRHLKEENDRISRQRKTLEREIEKRKILLASRERTQEAGEDGSQAENGVNGEKGDGLGVERALLEVRGWLDEALRTWSATGILLVPAQRSDAIPLPVTRRIGRPRKEKKTRRGRPAGEAGRAGSQDPDEIDPDLSHDTENELDDQEIDREDGPVVDVVDPDMPVAVDGHDPAAVSTQAEEVQAQQNLQRILAMYSASAGAGEPDTGVDGVGPEGQDGEGDEHMQDMTGGREEGTDIMEFLERRP